MGREEGKAFVEHHGVLGMKWGVRRDRSSGGSSSSAGSKVKRAARVVGRGASYTAFESMKDSDFVHSSITKAAGDKLKEHDLPGINAKHAASGGSKLGHRLRKPFSPEAKAYRADVKSAYLKRLEESANEITDFTGRRQYTLSEKGKPNTSQYYWTVRTKAVAHSDSASADVQPIFDSDGFITSVEHVSTSVSQSALFVEDFLSHHGILGMKWGVRRSKPSAVTVAQKGKKLKTSGGFERSASVDAKRAAQIHQIKKKSGVVALSNNDLQAYQQRLNLEANVKRLDYARSNPAKKFVLSLLGQTGKNVATNVASEEATKRVKKLLVKGAVTAAAAAA